jgi:hypothetical protein
MPTHAISLCKTDRWPRLPHLTVTPAQFFSVTVPRSLLSSRQQTGADIQQSGLGAGHSLRRVVALSRPVPAVERFGVRCERYGLMSDKAIIEGLSIAIARPGIAADAPARTPTQFVAQEY